MTEWNRSMKKGSRVTKNATSLMKEMKIQANFPVRRNKRIGEKQQKKDKGKNRKHKQNKKKSTPTKKSNEGRVKMISNKKMTNLRLKNYQHSSKKAEDT